MRLKYNGRNKKLKEAVKIANRILKSDKFYNEIKKHEKFDNTDLTNSKIANFIKTFKRIIIVNTWRNPLSKANAKTGNSKSISINLSKVNRKKKVNKIVNTLIHEYVHVVDYENKSLEFTHVDNSNVNGEENNTAPWAIGSIAFKMV